MNTLSVCLILLLCAAPLSAQILGESGQSFARGLSWATVANGVALKTWDAWQQPKRTKALVLEGSGLAATGLSSLLVKTLVHRDRPCVPVGCGSEDPHASFWSGHVANACYLIPMRSGKGPAIVGSLLAPGTAVGRILGNRHFLTDTLAGCAGGLGFGWLAQRLQ